MVVPSLGIWLGSGWAQSCLKAIKKYNEMLDINFWSLYITKTLFWEAVKNHGDAPQYAITGLNDIREIILEAGKTPGWVLEYTSEKLQKDKKVV